MDINVTDILTYVAPVLTGIAGWWGGRKKKRNDFLGNLQASIDLLAEKNRILMEEVVKLREENAKLRLDIAELTRKLEGVKTITRKA
ncbi:MAG: hypothetical protein LBD91_03145 [Prevotellaceae bacterium]|jgi:regulator of replication initiation timing|nr:hypothetical protein [Prevotellaceae bacterium]